MRYACLFFCLFMLYNCEKQRDGTETYQPENNNRSSNTSEPITIRAVPAERVPFSLRTITTGHLSAARQAEISMPVSGLLQELPLSEGQLIKEGDLMAKIDDTALRFQLDDYQFAYEDALLKKNDLLIANGGQAGVDTSVNPQKLKLIIIESGFERAKQNIRRGEHELAQARLLAPFSGIVAELEARRHQQINAGEKICRLIDPQSFQVVFQVLETDALQVRKGQVVKVFPNARPDLELSASVANIDPIVSENGLVKIKADLRFPKSFQPLEGLKVKVYLEKRIPNQIVIPKSALVLRSGRQVVFVYDPDESLAKWHYVEVAYENNEQLAIGEGLEAGDLVIHEGNLNLAHDAEVTLDEVE